MAIDRYEDLPGIISELQDGGLQIFDGNEAPPLLVLGTASKGASNTIVSVDRAQEFENRFGKDGTLTQGVYESLSGGAGNVNGMRIGARSAIVYGVGTDDMNTDPTTIETLLKDEDASKLYLLRYVSPATRGPDEEVGHLIIKNAVGTIVYNNNPGKQPVDTGEVLVSGDFTGGVDIGNPADVNDFVLFEDIAKDKLSVIDTFAAVDEAPASFNLAHTPNAGSVKAFIGGTPVSTATFTVNGKAVSFTDATVANGKEVKISYEYDGNSAVNIRYGSDGINLSKMELYEAFEDAYRQIETEEYKWIVPMGVEVDTPNVTDGDLCILSTDAKIQFGRRYPVAGTAGDVLGKLFIEEYEGEFFYFWDINGDGKAEIFPLIGNASATKKIDGSALTSTDFKEVNFAYQLANFCFTASANEYNVLGVIGSSLPKSFSPKDVSRWIGKEPTYDSEDTIIENGTGLLGNKIMVSLSNHKDGLFATKDGNYQGAAGSLVSGVEVDRGGRPVDIGRYIEVYVHPQTFYNPIDTTGYGYNANGAAYYAGLVTTLKSQSAPTNKIATNAESAVKLSKAKLNSLAKYGYIALKHKNRVFRFSDAPTAARKDSDFRRVTTMRVVAEVIDDIRRIAEPYIGEANTKASRTSLETNIKTLLVQKQDLGVIQRFELKISATTKQRIEGDMTVELVLVPPFEVRKIEIITSLAKE